MLRYFKVNDPYRLLVILVLLVLTRVAVVLLENPFDLLANESLQLGLQLNQGNPFPQVAGSNAGPLFEHFMGLLTWIAPESSLLSIILSGLLVLAQAFILNTILVRNAAFKESSYVPALVYGLLAGSSLEFIYLSPEMMALTFVLIGVHYLLIHLKYRGTEENILSTGFMFGLAALFCKPAFFGLLFVILVYAFYSGTLRRRYFLMGFGFLLPFVLVWIYFLWRDAGSSFWNEYFASLFQGPVRSLMPLQDRAIGLILPLFISLLAMAQHFTGIGMTNNQIQIQRAMLWLLLFGLGWMLLSQNGTLTEGLWLFPAVTYFLTLWIESREKPLWGEALLWLLLLSGIYFTMVPLLGVELPMPDLSLLRASFN